MRSQRARRLARLGRSPSVGRHQCQGTQKVPLLFQPSAIPNRYDASVAYLTISTEFNVYWTRLANFCLVGWRMCRASSATGTKLRWPIEFKEGSMRLPGPVLVAHLIFVVAVLLPVVDRAQSLPHQSLEQKNMELVGRS